MKEHDRMLPYTQVPIPVKRWDALLHRMTNAISGPIYCLCDNATISWGETFHTLGRELNPAEGDITTHSESVSQAPRGLSFRSMIL